VTPVTAREHAQAAGSFFDLATSGSLRHLGTTELTAALDGAVKRPLGDAWAWSRKSSSVDISPLVACTIALWGAGKVSEPSELIYSMSEEVEKLRSRQQAEQSGDAPIYETSPGVTFHRF
jgi:hypothetical protein